MVIELIDPNGSVPIETDADILALRSDGCLRTIQLDANLTLDLAKVGGKKTPAGTSGALPLLQVAALSDSAIDCDLAIEELSLGAVRATGDTTRAVTLRRDVATGLSFVERELGVRRGSILVGHLGSKEVRSYQRVHLLSYVHLLRIEQIARDRPGKATAVDNVAEYVRWANHDLRSISAHSLQVALDVFGGEPRAARLLGVASSRSQEGRAWNAAWDLVYCHRINY